MDFKNKIEARKVLIKAIVDHYDDVQYPYVFTLSNKFVKAREYLGTADTNSIVFYIMEIIKNGNIPEKV